MDPKHLVPSRRRSSHLARGMVSEAENSFAVIIRSKASASSIHPPIKPISAEGRAVYALFRGRQEDHSDPRSTRNREDLSDRRFCPARNPSQQRRHMANRTIQRSCQKHCRKAYVGWFRELEAPSLEGFSSWMVRLSFYFTMLIV